MRNQHLARLFERFRTRGSTAALARVFDATAPALLRVARRLSGDLAQAEDAVQSTFLAAIERAPAWDGTRPLEPWLFGILVRQVGLARRRAARVVDPSRLAVDPPEDPASIAERSELVAAVERALEGLSQRDREVLVPWLAGEARGGELADRLGVGGSTLRMRRQRGLARLRRALPVGFGAGVALTVAERRALAQTRTHVLAAALRPGTVIGAGGSLVAKFAIATLVVAAAIGGAVLLRPTRSPTADAARLVEPAAAAIVRAPTAIAPVRSAEPAARAAANETGIDGDAAGGAIATTTTAVAIRAGSPAFAGLEVEVVAEDRTAVSGARLRLFDDEGERGGAFAEATTTADGTSRFPFEEIRFLHVVADHANFARAVQPTTSLGRITLTLAEGMSVSGSVTREDGAPVANATVEVADGATRFVGPLVATADAMGRYSIAHVARRLLWIRARSPDGARVGCNFSARAADGRVQTPRLDLVVRPTANLSFAITSAENGRPVESALVVVRVGPDSTTSKDAEFRGASRLLDLDPFGAELCTDGAGASSLAGIPADAPIRVAVAAAGFAPAWRELDALHDGETRAATFALERPCTVAGVARNRDGSPLARARIDVEPFEPIDELRSIVFENVARNPFWFETTSGGDGAFRLEGLPPMARHLLRLEANHRFAFAALELPRAGDVQDGVVLTLDAKVRIEGTIVADDGPLPKGTQLWLQPASELAQVGANGHFEFEITPKLGETVWAVAPGYVHAKAEVEAPLAAVNHVVITLRRGLSIEGHVEDGAHHAVAGARILAWPADPTPEESARSGGWITEVNLASTVSEMDGTFRLRGLGEHDVRLVVTAEGFDERSIDRLAPGVGDVAVTLTAPR